MGSKQHHVKLRETRNRPPDGEPVVQVGCPKSTISGHDRGNRGERGDDEAGEHRWRRWPSRTITSLSLSNILIPIASNPGTMQIAGSSVVPVRRACRFYAPPWNASCEELGLKLGQQADGKRPDHVPQ